MKRKTAKEILADSFRELAEKKNVDKITVKEIADNCGYSVATFYRQFNDKYDLIAWEQAQRVSGIMNQIGIDDYPWKQTLLDGAIMFEDRRDYLANLLLHTSGHDSFIRYKSEINYNALKNHILKANNLTEIDKTTDMYIRVYTLGTVSLTCEWILGKYNATPEEMAEIYENSLPQPLKQYLY